MKRVLCSLLMAFLVPAAAFAQQGALDDAAATITQDDFAWRVGVIAHDSMQGRNTPSVGLDKTAEWVASEFRRFGLTGGAGDGRFIQRYPLLSTSIDRDASGIDLGDGTVLKFGTDVALLFPGGVNGARTGPVALVSGALRAGEMDVSALKGHHVIIVLPPGLEDSPPGLFGFLGSVFEAGALSTLMAASPSEGAWQNQLANSSRAQVRYPDSESGGQQFVPLFLVKSSSIRGALQNAGVKLDELEARSEEPGRIDLVPELDFTVTQALLEEEVTAPNVVAILEGSDPELKDEYVVFSGHMDHIGMGMPNEDGDSIYTGADDDASGTVAVMEIAEAMASLPTAPRRSMVFLIVSGEEKGLFGSQYYSDHPTVPMEQIVANLNTDMVGRNWPDTIVAIGKEHSDLGETMNRINSEHPELRMTAIDDIWPEENFYFRSDHYNFARKGVPILFFFNGTHEDYHGLDDEPDRIDAEKAARIARLVFYLGAEVANADERPKWNPESYEQIVSD